VKKKTGEGVCGDGAGALEGWCVFGWCQIGEVCTGDFSLIHEFCENLSSSRSVADTLWNSRTLSKKKKRAVSMFSKPSCEARSFRLFFKIRS